MPLALRTERKGIRMLSSYSLRSRTFADTTVFGTLIVQITFFVVGAACVPKIGKRLSRDEDLIVV